MIRRLALEVAVPSRTDADGKNTFVEARVDRAIARERLEPRDAALLRTIACGAVRHRGSLDAVLRAFARSGTLPDDERIRELLRQGAFQLVFLDRVPDHAAVDETVALVRRVRAPLAGFANAVLRSIARESRVDEGDSEGDPASAPAGRREGVRGRSKVDDWFTLPRPDGTRVRFGRAILPDPEAEPVRWFAEAYSLPEWLVTRWRERYGDDRTRALSRSASAPPRVTVRVRPSVSSSSSSSSSPSASSASRPEDLRDVRDALVEQWRAAGIDCGPGARDDSVRLASPGGVERLPGFAEGRIAVQGEAAMEVTEYVAVRCGDRVLDVAAAPGGKSVALADAGAGSVVAIDVSKRRVGRIRENASRHGARGVRPVVADGRSLPFAEGVAFERVLLDAPCSNTGVLAKRAEARWRLDSRTLRSLVVLQSELLEAVGDRVARGGILVYSTCSVEPDENEEVAHAVLPRLGFRLDRERTYLPGDPYDDGGYVSAWRRAGDGPEGAAAGGEGRAADRGVG